MGDLTDERVDELIEWTKGAGYGHTHLALIELKELRAAQSASAERVRSVVMEVAMTEVCAAVSWLMGPTYWYDNPSAHGRWEKTADAIAERVTSQLAVPVLSDRDFSTIAALRGLVVAAAEAAGKHEAIRAATALLDRLLGAKP